MTQDEIIEMAESAELVVSKHSVWTPEKRDFTFMGYTLEGDLANLMQFAKLVAQHEREACAKVCEDYGRAEEMQAIGNDFAEQIRARGRA